MQKHIDRETGRDTNRETVRKSLTVTGKCTVMPLYETTCVQYEDLYFINIKMVS